MLRKKNSLSLTMTSVIVLSAVVVLVTGVIGFLLSSQSGDAMRTLIVERMLDISNTAAAMMDGDALANMTEEDIGSPEFEKGMQTLRTLGKNMAWMLKHLNAADAGYPERERPIRTNFIS